MRYLLVALVASCLLIGLAQAYQRSWEGFKLRYGKIYSSAEEELKRRTIYEERVAALVNDDKDFEQDVNHLFDLRHAEFRALNGLRLNLEQVRQGAPVPNWMIDETTPVPESVDWSTEPNRVGRVKDQGKCGSCWAFAVTGLLEGQEYRNSTANQLVELSEQEIIDCDHYDQGCGGGDPETALRFVKDSQGIDTEKDYPYMSKNGHTYSCKMDIPSHFITTRYVKGASHLPTGDEEKLKRVVARYGPVLVALDARYETFLSYSSGVYYEPNCKNKLRNLDHAVLVVGYGTDAKGGDYWLIKNSWSENWGMKGYMKLARNRENHCGVATMAMIAV